MTCFIDRDTRNLEDLKVRVIFSSFLPSAGELGYRKATRHYDKRWIYLDLADSNLYSVNNQQGENRVDFEKPALCLTIYKANHEGCLAEHMLIAGVRPNGKRRITFFPQRASRSLVVR